MLYYPLLLYFFFGMAAFLARALYPAAGTVDTWTDIVVEIIFIFMLCFVVPNGAASKQNKVPTDGNLFFVLAIGFVIVMGRYAVGDITGIAFNPAIASSLGIKHCGLCLGVGCASYELVGPVLAALLCDLVRPEGA